MPDKEVKIKVAADVDDEQVKELEELINNLADKAVSFEVVADDDELDEAGSKEESLNGSAEFVVDVEDSDLQMAMQNLSEGVGKAKQGVLDLKDAIQEVEQAGMQSEQNKAFLEMNLGADKAKQTYQDISDIVASMPGDDNTMRSVLSTAQALGNDLKPEEMAAATKTMADYMSGSATMGKMATESQQDIMKYLLDGNTAELERGSIVSSQVDKLKDATTFMERQKAMQEVLNDLGYGGISTQDTMLNKQAEWEGMIYNSSDALSSMWLDAEKGAMDYIIQLNDASNGLVGMGIVAGSVAGGPLFDTVSGLGQMAMGLNALKTAYEGTAIATAIAEGGFWSVAAAELAALWPVLAVVAALVLLGAAVYEVGVYFGWWTDVGSMIDAVWAGIQRLWSAFINHPDVQAFIQGMMDAWAALQPVIASVISWVMSFFQNSSGDKFDVVRALIDMIGAAWQATTGPLNAVIGVLQALWGVITTTMGYWNQASAKARQVSSLIRNAFSGVRGSVQSAFSGVTSAITSPFMSAYNTIKPIIDKIKWAYDMLGSLGSSGISLGSAGVSVGSAGISMGSVGNVGNANSKLMSQTSYGGTTNISLNGIIEESAGEFIVRKLNDEIYRQNVLRGV